MVSWYILYIFVSLGKKISLSELGFGHLLVSRVLHFVVLQLGICVSHCVHLTDTYVDNLSRRYSIPHY